jgi:voltage-dependent potassium channel beta subunit
MKYRRLGNAGTKVSAVSLGGWTTFGESIQDQDLARQIITMAYDSAINFFDIADVYAKGESEKMMGQVLKEFPRHTLVVSSKVFGKMSDDVNDRGLSRKHIMESIDKSLQRIGTDYLDIYYCHRYDPETPLEEVVRAMDDLIHRGKIIYWGTSEWPAAKIEEAYGLARQYNLYPPQVEQTGYHMMRRQRVENEVLPVAEPKGMGMTTFSPLANGLLTGKYDEVVPDDSRYGRQDDLDEKFETRREKVRQLKPLADELGITRAQLAVAWCLRWPAVSSVIGGATKPAQVKDNVKAAEVELPEEIIAKIDELMPIQPWP